MCDGKGMWEKQRRNHGLGLGSLPKDLLGLAGTPLAGTSVGRQRVQRRDNGLREKRAGGSLTAS